MDAERIDVMLAEGIDFGVIEERIARARLPETVKDVLWLYAFCWQDRGEQRRWIAEVAHGLSI